MHDYRRSGLIYDISRFTNFHLIPTRWSRRIDEWTTERWWLLFRE